MEKKKNHSIGLLLPMLLLVSVVMLAVYLMMMMLDRRLTQRTVFGNSENSAADSAVSAAQTEVTTAPASRDITCYSSLMQELLAEYGEPRAVRDGDAIGVIGTVYNPDLYFLDGVYARLVDMDADSIPELYCAAIDHQNDVVHGTLYAASENEVRVLMEQLPVMYLPEDSVQTVLMRSASTGGYYAVREQYNPNGDPVVLRNFFQKTGNAISEIGRYISGEAEDKSKYSDYIHVDGLTAIPLSLATEDRAQELQTTVSFPAVGQSQRKIEMYAEESAEVISRILK